MSIRLLVVAGPTACGKTRLAVDVAHALGSEILSADSRQTYRGLDIGSGKDLDEYRQVAPPVPHHLIDVEGLAQDVIHLSHAGDLLRDLPCPAGDQDDDRIRGQCFHLLRHVPPGPGFHPQIREHELRGFLGKYFKRRGAVGGDIDVKVSHPEEIP